MRKLITQSGGQLGHLGLDLRGEWVTVADAVSQKADIQLMATMISQFRLVLRPCSRLLP